MTDINPTEFWEAHNPQIQQHTEQLTMHRAMIDEMKERIADDQHNLRNDFRTLAKDLQALFPDTVIDMNQVGSENTDHLDVGVIVRTKTPVIDHRLAAIMDYIRPITRVFWVVDTRPLLSLCAERQGDYWIVIDTRNIRTIRGPLKYVLAEGIEI